LFNPELNDIEVEVNLRQLLSAEMAWEYRLVPAGKEEGTICFYTDKEPLLQTELINELEILLGQNIKFTSVDSYALTKALSRYYPKEKQSSKKISSANVSSEEFVVQLIAEAKELRSSDIHIEPYEERSRIRIRIDGQLVERFAIEKSQYPALINKIKIMANLDIAEKRLPQDGRIFYNNEGVKFDIRVSVLPTLFGEKVVMRILSNDASHIELSSLGFSEENLHHYLEGIKMPNGILLISGPTGSGKTTTLYATLKELNTKERNILTIEDPIEYTLEGINQVQLKEAIGLDFAKALKTFLRQDPDVIMLGEIRDPETANMAVRAALTGHLVLSTIHTNSAWGTVSRLIDMGVPPYLLASTLNTSVAQRLLRLLCPVCKERQEFSEKLYPNSFKPSVPVPFHYKAVGCDECFYTGYKGRKAVYEVIAIDEELADSIKEVNLNVRQVLREKGYRSLTDSAFELFKNGMTTISEVYPLLYTE
jgi:type IV pilus assembly protein PilB